MLLFLDVLGLLLKSNGSSHQLQVLGATYRIEIPKCKFKFRNSKIISPQIIEFNASNLKNTILILRASRAARAATCRPPQTARRWWWCPRLGSKTICSEWLEYVGVILVGVANFLTFYEFVTFLNQNRNDEIPRKMSSF